MNIEGGSGSFPDEGDERREAEERREMEERMRKDEEIVSSVGAMRRLGGELPFTPTSEAEIPDIRMQLEQEEDPNERLLRNGEKERHGRLRNEEDDSYWRADPYFRRIVKDLRTLSQEKNERGEAITEEEKMQAREKLPKMYEKLVKSELKEMSGLLNETLMKYKNPYPYDSREMQYWLSGLDRGIEKAMLEFDDNVEAKAWLKMMKADCLWGKGTVNLWEGVGPIVKGFWSGTQMMNAVRERMRNDPEASDYVMAFAEKLPGLEIKKKEDKDRLIPKEVESLRKKAIKFQDDNTFWRMAVSAVEQLEYDKEGKLKRNEEKKADTFVDLTDREIKFIQELFGGTDKDGKVEWVEYDKEEFPKYKGERFPKKINNIYTSNSVEDGMREYKSLMESLLELGVKDKLESGDFEDLLEKVKTQARERQASWYEDKDKDIDSMLAGLVVSSGIAFDWGHGASSWMGWGWKYEMGEEEKEDEEEEEGGEKKKDEEKKGVSRSRIMGGTTTAMDLTTERYWFASHVKNKSKGWTVNTMLPKMSEEMMKLMSESSPDYKPKLEDYSKLKDEEGNFLGPVVKEAKESDKVLAKAWEWLFDYSWSGEERKWLEDNVWWWDTGIVGSKEGKRKGQRIILPVFFPTEVEGLNFLDTFSLTGEMKVKNFKKGEKPDPSVWDELRKGKNISEIEWSKMPNQKFYKWMITLGQAMNETAVLLQDMGKENEGSFKKFFESSDNLPELVKRVNLGLRDGKSSKAMLTMSYISFIVPLFVAKHQADIVGSGGSSELRQDDFVKRISDWWDEIDSLSDKGDELVSKHYAKGMARMLKFNSSLIVELGAVLGERERKEKIKRYDNVRGTLKEITGRGLR